MHIKNSQLVTSLPSAGFPSFTSTATRPARGVRAALACLLVAAVCGLVWLAPLPASAQLSPQFSAVASGALIAAPANGLVLLAQVDIKDAMKSLLEFLSWVMIAMGVCLVAYGAIRIAQGHQMDGGLAIVGGFILVLAVPIIYYFAKLAGTQF